MAGEQVGTFVQRRGATKQRTAFGVGGAVGAAIGSGAPDAAVVGDPGELLGASGLGHLAVGAGELVLVKAKGGLKHKPTDEVLATVARNRITSASFDGKLLMGILSIEFNDGSRWEFDVPRQYKKSATEVAQALNS